MGKAHRPQRGSHGYSPRKRANSHVARFRSWPEGGEKAQIQGFAGYKAGMTHILMTDYRPHSLTSGQEVVSAVTVVECPPIQVAAARVYTRTPYGLTTLAEAWASETHPTLARALHVPKSKGPLEADAARAEDIRLIAHTLPTHVTGLPQKTPDLMEIRVGGGSMEDRIGYANEILGHEVKVDQVLDVGKMVDVAAITQGYGFQGSPVRWGVRLQTHKNSKNRRDTTPLGNFRPPFVRATVPMPGQTGYHQRVEYNKRVIAIGANPDEINPKGGFLHYGLVRNPYVILHGSIPGPAKRVIRFRHALRYHGTAPDVKPTVHYLSRESKQGV